MSTYALWTGRKPVNATAAKPQDPNALYDQAITDEGSGVGAQKALGDWTGAALSSAMPAFNQQLQSIRESAIRRGIGTGDLGTSYEGDLASAFEKNNANAVAGQAANMYDQSRNRYYDLLTGKMDRTQAQSNAKRQSKDNIWSGALGLAGSVLGGPIGGKIGGLVGKGLSKLGHLF